MAKDSHKCIYGHRKFIRDSGCWGAKTRMVRELVPLEFIISTQQLPSVFSTGSDNRGEKNLQIPIQHGVWLFYIVHKAQ